MNNPDDFDIFFKNTGSALEVIGSLPSSYLYRFPGLDAFILSTGVRYADENWVWVKSDSYSQELLIEVVERFKEKSLQFIWPVFSDSDIQMSLDMDDFGLLTRKIFRAMILDSAVDKFTTNLYNPAYLRFSARRAITPEDALLWAATCWKGFTEAETEEDVPREFVELACNAALNDRMSLVLGFVNEEPAGTFMLCKGDGIMVSHFCVLPALRNLGVGNALMNEIIGYNNLIRNRYLVLVATIAGERLYRKFGFRNVADVAIRSFSENI